MAEKRGCAPALDHRVKDIDGKDVDLCRYQGNVLLIVNTASYCGYTPQYAGLEQLYQRYKDRGFRVLAFPSNDFGRQEPGTDAEIKTFCSSKFHVTFDLFSKVAVKGPDEAGLYKFLTSPETNGPFAGEIGWNFQKYVLSREGKVVAKFSSNVEPLSDEVAKVIEAHLGRS